MSKNLNAINKYVKPNWQPVRMSERVKETENPFVAMTITQNFGWIFLCVGQMHTLNVCINNSNSERLTIFPRQPSPAAIRLYQTSLLRYSDVDGNATSSPMIWMVKQFFFHLCRISLIFICLCLQALYCVNNFLKILTLSGKAYENIE